MCDHKNLDVYVKQTTLTACKNGKLESHSTVVTGGARVVCACGANVFYDPPADMPVNMVKEKAVHWFLMVQGGPETAKTWLKSLQLAVARNKSMLDGGNLSYSDRYRLQTLVKRQEAEIEQVKNLIILMETK